MMSENEWLKGKCRVLGAFGPDGYALALPRGFDGPEAAAYLSPAARIDKFDRHPPCWMTGRVVLQEVD